MTIAPVSGQTVHRERHQAAADIPIELTSAVQFHPADPPKPPQSKPVEHFGQARLIRKLHPAQARVLQEFGLNPAPAEAEEFRRNLQCDNMGIIGNTLQKRIEPVAQQRRSHHVETAPLGHR